MPSVQETNFMKVRVKEVCDEAGIAADSSIRQILLQSARIVDGPRSTYDVRSFRTDGNITLQEHLDELRNDGRFAKHFGEKPTELSAKEGIDAMRDHFADIAAGRVRVVD